MQFVANKHMALSWTDIMIQLVLPSRDGGRKAIALLPCRMNMDNKKQCKVGF